MPIIGSNENVNITGGHAYSPVRVETLDVSECTLVTLVFDLTGSVDPFEDKINALLKQIVETCQDLPTNAHIVVRVIGFNSYMGVKEFIGFTPIIDIDINDLPKFECDGMTNLIDATHTAIDASITEAGRLTDEDYGVNAVMFVITDGDDNKSKQFTTSDIKGQLISIKRTEVLEDFNTVVIGVKDPDVTDQLHSGWSQRIGVKLKEFTEECGITKFVELGDATEEAMKKLGWNISQSISSSSNAIVSGGPSQLTF